VSAPLATQRARVLARPGMSETGLAAILARQMPDAAKRRRADTVVRTGLSRHHAQAALRRAVARWRGEWP
ncbi:MAG: dephospho-CoA kinase, partial [Acetobacteraceae bacterium]